MKKIIIFLIIGILFFHSIITISISVKNNELLGDLFNESMSISQQSKIVIIESIEDGLGLKINIRNVDDETIENIILKIEVIEFSIKKSS